ncbi:MAG: M24 family metallopeptidase [Proteobacteria bacterium]|nr:M24 family metallopeptidase [Pseudomonadota bacterium]
MTNEGHSKFPMEVSDLEGIRAETEEIMCGHARDLTWQAVNEIRSILKPGMSEFEAIGSANSLLAKMGVRKFWHRTHIRFGASTVLSFDDPYLKDVRLRADDIANIDIGPIWNGVEGDAGCAVVFGNNPRMMAIAADAKLIFNQVRLVWQESHCSGEKLHLFAEEVAQSLGYVLHPTYVKGHRLAEFPHSFYSKGHKLFDLASEPKSKRWVLEIHICEPNMKFGAFYEDILF